MSETSLPPTAGTVGKASLKQRVQLLETANQFLIHELADTRRRLAEATGEDSQQVMDDLIAQLNKLSKERLEQEREQIKEKEKKRDEKAADGKKKKNPQTGHGPREQPALPLVEEIHEFAPDDRRCTICGQEMDPLGDQFEEYEEIDYVELQYQRKLVKRRKMRCSCNACVRTAPGPPRLIRGGRYSVDFAIHVAINKYADHLPLERQCRRMARYGLIVPSQTLWDQIYALARILGPTYEALGWEVLKSDLLYVDETRWFDLSKGATSPWTVWTRSTEKIAHYTILSKKNTRVAKRLFKDFSGTLVVDGYTVYEKLVAEDEANTLRLVNCWVRIPSQADHPFRRIATTDSNPSRPPIPIQADHFRPKSRNAGRNGSE